MKRRHFLGSSALAVAAAAWPGWLRRAFADASVDLPGAGSPDAARQRARSDGKPLLEIVIPSGDADKYAHGRAIGRLINHGSDEELAALALCEVACFPSVAGGREPWMILHDEPHGSLPQISPASPPKEGAELPREQLALPIHREVMGSRALLQRRAAEARAAIGPAIAAQVDRELAVADPSAMALPLVDRGAAIVALAADGAPPQRRQILIHLLARTAAARLRDHEIAGSKWARQLSCGTEIENALPDEQTAVDCGMGHVPDESARFLWFFTRKKS